MIALADMPQIPVRERAAHETEHFMQVRALHLYLFQYKITYTFSEITKRVFSICSMHYTIHPEAFGMLLFAEH